MTRLQIIYEAIRVAMTGPSKDPRRKGESEDRLQYLADAVETALLKRENEKAEPAPELEIMDRPPPPSRIQSIYATLNEALGPLEGGAKDRWQQLDDVSSAVEAMLRRRENSEPFAAWVFELAGSCAWRDGKMVYTNFGPPQLSFTRPNVPEGSIRNLKALRVASS